MKSISVYSLGNGQLAVVVEGEGYTVFDTPPSAREYIGTVNKKCQVNTENNEEPKNGRD